MQEEPSLCRNVDQIVADAVLHDFSLTNDHVPRVELVGARLSCANEDVVGSDGDDGTMGGQPLLGNALELDPWSSQ